MNPLKTFIIYARSDEDYKKQLLLHLRPLVSRKAIEVWHDGNILPGEQWEKAIMRELKSSDLVLVLVSANSLNSEFILTKELQTALERLSVGLARVVPVVVSPCAWHLDPMLSDLQAPPLYGKEGVKPVRSWPDPDEAWAAVVGRLGEMIAELREKRAGEERLSQQEIEQKRQLELREKSEKEERERREREETERKRLEKEEVERRRERESQKAVNLKQHEGRLQPLGRGEGPQKKSNNKIVLLYGIGLGIIGWFSTSRVLSQEFDQPLPILIIVSFLVITFATLSQKGNVFAGMIVGAIGGIGVSIAIANIEIPFSDESVLERVNFFFLIEIVYLVFALFVNYILWLIFEWWAKKVD